MFHRYVLDNHDDGFLDKKQKKTKALLVKRRFTLVGEKLQLNMKFAISYSRMCSFLHFKKNATPFVSFERIQEPIGERTASKNS